MSAAAATRSSPRTPWSSSQARPLAPTTPGGVPAKTPGLGGGKSSAASAKHLASPLRGPATPSSPNYFEYISDPNANPPNSNAGMHAKRNWSPTSGSDGPKTAETSAYQPLDTQKRFENFRRQSEGNTFSLNQGSLPHFSVNTHDRGSKGGEKKSVPGIARRDTGLRLSPTSREPKKRPPGDGEQSESMDIDPPDSLDEVPPVALNLNGERLSRPPLRPGRDSQGSLSGLQRHQLSHLDERHPRNSLPHNRVEALEPALHRAETLPTLLKTDGPEFIHPQSLESILKGFSASDILLLDLRVLHQYNKSRVHGAINLCIPTTLLKRASFNIQRLSASLTKEDDRAKFDQWREVKVIVAYDAGAYQLSDAASCINILKKFTNEEFSGATYMIRGGFNSFHKVCPDHVDQRAANEMNNSTAQGLSLEPPMAAPVAGGCEMPSTQCAANPFFGTIRQNMDLIGGVGQMPVTVPAKLKNRRREVLPTWLRQASDAQDQGKVVSERFLQIEKDEEVRMKKALSIHVSYGSSSPMSPNKVQVAGIEKGLKNRYKDILPFDHSRVRLQNIPSGGCDYVNASHVQAEGCKKRYIASQAPVPATFQDFWRVAWEQDVRVIVMLTAEHEGGNTKCHPYWLPADHGHFKLKSISERRVSLERAPKNPANRSFTAPITASSAADAAKPPGVSRRHSSKHSISSPSSSKSPAQSTSTLNAITSTPSSSSSPSPAPLDPDTPHVILHKLALSNTDKPFEPLREITQLQFSSWPDFGAPAHPAQVLNLVERCNSVTRSTERSHAGDDEGNGPVQESRPVIVHCSAGCGRTGTFCTIDSVIDMLKQQRVYRKAHPKPTQPLRRPSHQRHSSSTASSFRSPARSRPSMPARASTSHPTTITTATSGKDDPEAMDIDGEGESSVGPEDSATPSSWLDRDDIDLVARTVASLRHQRLSMVQTLRQFVLCYESVLEWIATGVEGEDGEE